MAAYEPQLIQIAAAHLPSGAELAMMDQPYACAAVCAADMNGDRIPEVAAVYRSNGELYLLVLAFRDGAWTELQTLKGVGGGVTHLSAMPITRAGSPNLIVGWRIDAAMSKLSVYELTRNGIRDAASPDMCFTAMEAMDMPGLQGVDGKAELALWSGAGSGAYQVEVLRWTNGAFLPAPDVYGYYFPKVALYYEQLTRQYPNSPFYWHCLAEAQFRAGMFPPALASIRQALDCVQPPSREAMLDLERSIRSALEPIHTIHANNEIDTLHTTHINNTIHRIDGANTAEPIEDARAIYLYPASLKTTTGTRWGYIDRSGRMAIPTRFSDAMDFQPNGLAVAAERGKYGLIDASAAYVVKPVYDSIGTFSEGRATVIDAEGFKLIDEKGNVVTKRAYPFIADMHDGRSLYYVMTDGGDNGGESKYGYLDAQGNEAIPAQFPEANDFHQGKAVVKIKDNTYALIGKDGRTSATFEHAYVGPLGDGLLAFQNDLAGKYGYINERGDIVLQPAFTSAFPFHNGRAIVNTAEDFKSKYGVINKRGTYVVQPGYNDIRDLGQDRFALGRAIDPEQPFIGSRFAIADWNGKRLTDFLFHDVSDFKNGLASATDGRQTYLIDRGGKPASGYPRVNGSGTLTVEAGGLIKAFIDQRLSYLARDGRIVWKQNTLIPLRPPYLVKELKYKPNPDYLVYFPQIDGMTDQAAQREANDKLKVMSQVKPIPPNQQLDYTYSGDFEVSFYKQQLLQLELTGYNFPFGAAHGMPTKTYAIIHLTNGRMFELKDLFKAGSDYVQVLSDIVGKQIKEDPQYSYVFPDTYKGIQPDQPFFVTENALHLYFQPYEIGPYAAGFPTFTIPFTQIGKIIDTEGEFWKSFHA
ncbi:DUF3298 domain-containing protein [Paenibacillus rhizovicinus]|uniref:DUF3298 domain-containing protein n=1 Tax=Paenibacillus rhizovicinus TaxID=2704463 RepID=A0A6C0P8F5_9BACL|nr:WG repeat-containing protein [Paenibacillus rhizovicinus]QHW34749.1 DUF3298 domain-containing protein [Paenibacillus rhizovicinus]